MENSTMYFVCMWLELIRIFTLDLSFESRVAVWSVKSVDFAATLAYGSGFFFFFNSSVRAISWKWCVWGGAHKRIKRMYVEWLSYRRSIFFPLCLPYKIVINPAMPQKHVVKLVKANLESAVLDYLWSDLNLRMKPWLNYQMVKCLKIFHRLNAGPRILETC